jgi:hypothetical protein
MNQVAKSKYEDMTTMAATLVRHMQELQDKCTIFSHPHCSAQRNSERIYFFRVGTDQKYQPYLAKIDEVESSLTELEKTCLLLDEYTLKLGTRPCDGFSVSLVLESVINY